MREKSIHEVNSVIDYIMQMRPLLRREALFSDGTKDYRNPMEAMPGDEVAIRFRTARDNVDVVRLCSGGRSYEMKLVERDDRFDYYEYKVRIGEERFFYHFLIHSGRMSCGYDSTGVRNINDTFFDFMIVPGFSTPGWAKGAVMYQIFVDRFCNGDTSNDVLNGEYYYIKYRSTPASNWEKYPDADNVAESYGGDLQGVMNKLDYLKELGVEVIYLNPIFVSPSYHKYDTQDYDYIDPHFGRIVYDEGELLPVGATDNRQATRYQSRVCDMRNLEASNALFAELTAEIHKRGMKIILDGVFNHCGSFNKWMDREGIYAGKEGYAPGAYGNPQSPYRDYFLFEDDGRYDGWWGHETLPKLHYERSKELCDYILRIAKKWMEPPYSIDGWRLDVAADLGCSKEYNHEFWRIFRKVVKETNPDALIVAEHYGDVRDWLMGDQWDTVMNYDAFMDPVTWYMTGVDKHSESFRDSAIANLSEFKGTMDFASRRMMTPSVLCAMNELSNHDHSRFLTRTNHKVGRARDLGCKAAEEDVNRAVFMAANVLLMTWPGAPTIYYGDEAGVCGFTDPDNRRTYPWGEEDMELLNFHREIIRIHKSSEAFRTGSLKLVPGNDKILCYGRFTRKEQFLVLINAYRYSGEVSVPVWLIGIKDNDKLRQLIFTSRDGYSVDKVMYDITGGYINIYIPKYSSVVLKAVSAN